MKTHCFSLSLSLVVVCLLTATALTQNVDTTTSGAQCSTLPCVTTYHNDNARTGVNSNEVSISPSVLTSHTFGVLGSVTVDGLVYAQPLYLSGVPMSTNGGVSTCSGTYNIFIVATENNSVYAYRYTTSTNSNGQNQVTPVLCWKRNLNGTSTINPEHAISYENLPIDSGTNSACANLIPQVGISSTPVVDTSINPAILYVVSAHQIGPAPYTYDYRLHAIYVNQGTDVASSYEDLSQLINAAGGPASNFENQRAGLALTTTSANGTKSANVYVTFGSFCDANATPVVFNGYILGINFNYGNKTWSSLGAFITEPPYSGIGAKDDGGIWMSGAAPAVDSAGNLYAAVGNGAWNGKSGARTTAFGNSVVKVVSTGTSLVAADYYTPNDYDDLNFGDKSSMVCTGYSLTGTCPATNAHLFSLPSGDYDLGAGGVVLVSPVGFNSPCTAANSSYGELIAAGKEGVAYGICYSTSTVTSPLQTVMGGLDGPQPSQANGGYSTSNHSNDKATACTTYVSSNNGVPGPGGIAQCFEAVDASAQITSMGEPGVRGITAFWGAAGANYLYAVGSNDPVNAYQMLPPSGQFFTTPVTNSPTTYSYPGMIPAITWDGVNTSNGVLWGIETAGFGRINKSGASQAASSALLHAYYALPQSPSGTNVILEITLSNNAGPGAVKFAVPTVANGLIFVGGGSSGYAPGATNTANANCTSEADSGTLPTCQGLVTIFGELQ